MKERLRILNVWVDPLTRSEAIERVETFLSRKKIHAIFAVNPEKNFSVPKDKVLLKVFRDSDLLIPDGIGIVLAAKILYGTTFNRIPGVEFMEEICRLAVRKKKPVFIFGAKEKVNKVAVEKLQKNYPGILIAGRSNGYVPEQEMDDLVSRINKSSAEILFLAMGSPKQEKWFARYGPQLTHIKVCQGIGGSLDAIVGKVKRAPKIWQKCSAEWLFRLLAQPSRIKRQKVLPVFALAVVLAKLRKAVNM